MLSLEAPTGLQRGAGQAHDRLQARGDDSGSAAHAGSVGSHARLRSLVCGAVAGTGAKLLTYPLDTVKKRLQASGMVGG